MIPLKTQLNTQGRLTKLIVIAMFAVLSGLFAAGLFRADDTDGFVVWVLLPVVMLLGWYQFFTAVRQALQTFTFLDDHLEIKTAFRSKKKRIPLNKIEGYKRQLRPGAGKGYPVLLLFSDGKRVAEISGQFTRDFQSIEQLFIRQFPYLGSERYHTVRELAGKMLWK